jgi:tetratricopeptide (TPR) repeat protein
MMYARGPCDEGLRCLKPLLPSFNEPLKSSDVLVVQGGDENCDCSMMVDDIFPSRSDITHSENNECNRDSPCLANQLCVHNNMAQYLYEQGQLDKAIESLRRALDKIGQAQKLGATDDESKRFLSTLLSNMGHLHFIRGDLDQCLSYVIEALHHHEGGDDIFAASLWFNFGHLLCLLKYGPDEAECALKRALSILESLPVSCGSLGDRERNIVTVKTLLFAFLSEKQDSSTNVEERGLVSSLITERATLGYEHPSVVQTLCDIGTFYMKQNRHDEAIPYLKEAIRAQKNLHILDNDMFLTLTELGHCLQIDGRHEEAMHFFRKALRLKGNSIQEENDQLKTVFSAVLYNIGMIQSSHGSGTAQLRRTKALQSFRLCLGLRREVLGKDHPAVASTLHNIAVLLLEDGQVTSSLDCFRESLRIRRLAYGDCHAEVASSLQHIGRIHQDQGAYHESLRCHAEALSILRIVAPEGESHLVEVLMGLGQAQHSMGNLDAALASYEKAAIVLQQRQRKGQRFSARYMARIFTTMGNLSLDMNNVEAANDFYRQASIVSGGKQAPIVVERLSHPCAPAA